MYEVLLKIEKEKIIILHRKKLLKDEKKQNSLYLERINILSTFLFLSIKKMDEEISTN